MSKRVIVFAMLSLCTAATLAACAQLIGIEDLPETCGDAFVSPGEACDDGNTVSGDGCNAECTSDESCGNGYRDPGEICDDGGNSASCNANCTPPACGDAFVNPEAGERCEDGNTVAGDGCVDCRLECGNSVTDRNEECDAGDADGDGYADVTADCDGDCTTPLCGDGFANTAAPNTATADPGDKEQCDSQGAESADCDADCTIPLCGDGRFNAAAEFCDTGNSTATCDEDCTAPECGDGFTNPLALNTGTADPADREVCDEGGVNTGNCDFDCTDVVCGDGLHNLQAVEECDDGNVVDGDGCEADCSELPGESCNSYIDLGDVVELVESGQRILGNASSGRNDLPLRCNLGQAALSELTPEVFYSYTVSRDISLSMYFDASPGVASGTVYPSSGCAETNGAFCANGPYIMNSIATANSRYFFAVYSNGAYELSFSEN
jgi:cysteine-rich repeat protein